MGKETPITDAVAKAVEREMMRFAPVLAAAIGKAVAQAMRSAVVLPFNPRKARNRPPPVDLQVDKTPGRIVAAFVAMQTETAKPVEMTIGQLTTKLKSDAGTIGTRCAYLAKRGKLVRIGAGRYQYSG